MLVVALDGGLSVRYDNFLKTTASLVSKPHGWEKLGCVGAICWMKKELSWPI